jgi:hypothetical protein
LIDDPIHACENTPGDGCLDAVSVEVGVHVCEKPSKDGCLQLILQLIDAVANVAEIRRELGSLPTAVRRGRLPKKH